MWWAPRWGLPIIRDHLLKSTRPRPSRNSKSLESRSRLAKPIHKAAIFGFLQSTKHMCCGPPHSHPQVHCRPLQDAQIRMLRTAGTHCAKHLTCIKCIYSFNNPAKDTTILLIKKLSLVEIVAQGHIAARKWQSKI